MPNWCTNYVNITGAMDVMRKLDDQMLRASREEDSCLFGTFVIPAYNEDQSDWNGAQVEAWGTKWDVPYAEIASDGLDHLDDGRGGIYMRFDTAWSPPREWLKEMCELFPELLFEATYREDGMCFVGAMKGQGDIFVENTSDIPTPDDNFEEIDWAEFNDKVDDLLSDMVSAVDMEFDDELRYREQALSMLESED